MNQSADATRKRELISLLIVGSIAAVAVAIFLYLMTLVGKPASFFEALNSLLWLVGTVVVGIPTLVISLVKFNLYYSKYLKPSATSIPRDEISSDD